MVDPIVQMALRHKLLAPWQVDECVRLSRRIAAHGIAPKPLVTLIQLKGYLHPIEVGGLSDALVESRKIPTEEYRLAERAIQKGYTSVERVHECLRTREQFVELGLGPKSLLELMVHNRYLTEPQIALLRRR